MIYLLIFLSFLLFYSFVNKEYTEVKRENEFLIKRINLIETKLQDIIDEIKVEKIAKKSLTISKDQEFSKYTIS